ncbi:sporulation inhibitor of replication protein SirA [Peribacillus asahii]|uniref:Sporulation inhibitor of replication protein SirA n=1 Tax=Peribacillus asahii TaxID=228899 RepID=A0A398BGZ2_9BACI|nr:sporulation inhibitor of replication protein SirA [Peribacillus asahii]RID86920.1 sporulation inhibitor of replication protein SirA [Peribacillus asahii]
MRTYRVYLIEEEVAQLYFGRERSLFNLFLEYIQTTGSLRDILHKQIEYVTKIIPNEQVKKVIEQQKKQNFCYQNGGYYLEKNSGRSCASLWIHRDFLEIQSSGDYVAETAFFECIRKCGPSFLAIDFDHERFGWLKPIKERKFV